MALAQRHTTAEVAARSHRKASYTDAFDNAYTSNAHGTLL